MARIPIHPGDVLAEDLEALDMSASELARQLNVPGNRGASTRAAARALVRVRSVEDPVLERRTLDAGYSWHGESIVIHET